MHKKNAPTLRPRPEGKIQAIAGPSRGTYLGLIVVSVVVVPSILIAMVKVEGDGSCCCGSAWHDDVGSDVYGYSACCASGYDGSD